MTQTELSKEIANNKMAFMFIDQINESADVKKYIAGFYAKNEPLKGSEKQVAWATKIRAEKHQEIAAKIFVCNANEIGAKNGLKNHLQGYDYSAERKSLVKEAFSFCTSDCNYIINNK